MYTAKRDDCSVVCVCDDGNDYVFVCGGAVNTDSRACEVFTDFESQKTEDTVGAWTPLAKMHDSRAHHRAFIGVRKSKWKGLSVPQRIFVSGMQSGGWDVVSEYLEIRQNTWIKLATNAADTSSRADVPSAISVDSSEQIVTIWTEIECSNVQSEVLRLDLRDRDRKWRTAMVEPTIIGAGDHSSGSASSGDDDDVDYFVWNV